MLLFLDLESSQVVNPVDPMLSNVQDISNEMQSNDSTTQLSTVVKSEESEESTGSPLKAYVDLSEMSQMPGTSFQLVKLEDGNYMMNPVVEEKDKNSKVWFLNPDDPKGNEAQRILSESYNQFAKDVEKHIKNLPRSFFDKSVKKRAFYKAAQGTMKDPKFRQDFYRRKERST